MKVLCPRMRNDAWRKPSFHNMDALTRCALRSNDSTDFYRICPDAVDDLQLDFRPASCRGCRSSVPRHYEHYANRKQAAKLEYAYHQYRLDHKRSRLQANASRLQPRYGYTNH